MKIYNTAQFEKLNINQIQLNDLNDIENSSFIEYNYFPKTKEELSSIIIKRINNEGPNCNLNDIDISEITDMSDLFNYKINGNCVLHFNGDISKWNVSNVKDMHNMFMHCSAFNGDISKWNVSNVKDMHNMFMHCSNFNGDISQWDTHNVKNMDRLFMYCVMFNSDISSWKIDSVYTMEYMFYQCINFNQNLNDWNVSNVVNMNSLFSRCTKFNQPLDKWSNKIQKCSNMEFMFSWCESFNQDLSTWKIRHVQQKESIFYGCDLDYDYRPNGL